jgi:hypothetical protein
MSRSFSPARSGTASQNVKLSDSLRSYARPVDCRVGGECDVGPTLQHGCPSGDSKRSCALWLTLLLKET